MRCSTTTILIFLITVLTSCSSKKKEHVRIAVASNMQFAIGELVQEYELQTNNRCEVILGSSGKLASQIQAGAPYDLFISADTYYPQKLVELGFGSESPKIYARGKLVFISRDRISITDLTSSNVSHIAIANPRIAPYGKATLEVLKKLEVFNEIESKLIYAENISQVKQFVDTGAAEAGFTALSQLMNKNCSPVSDSLYTTIDQSLLVLKGNKEQQANDFVDFLVSTKAKQILINFGYSVE